MSCIRNLFCPLKMLGKAGFEPAISGSGIQEPSVPSAESKKARCSAIELLPHMGEEYLSK
jgi:hypothetical protein